jgi:hypothetical protein
MAMLSRRVLLVVLLILSTFADLCYRYPRYPLSATRCLCYPLSLQPNVSAIRCSCTRRLRHPLLLLAAARCPLPAASHLKNEISIKISIKISRFCLRFQSKSRYCLTVAFSILSHKVMIMMSIGDTNGFTMTVETRSDRKILTASNNAIN